MQKISINLLDILISKVVMFKKNSIIYINTHPFKASVSIIFIAIIYLNIVGNYEWFSIYHIPFFNAVPFKSILYYILLLLIISVLILIIVLILKHIKYKTIINIFDSNIHYQSNKSEQVVTIPKIIDHISIFKDKYFIYQINKQNNKLQLLTIINRYDPYFNKQKFWQTHTTYTIEYFKGNMPYKKDV